MVFLQELVKGGPGTNPACCKFESCRPNSPIKISSDFLNDCKLNFVSLQGLQPIPYPIKFKYKVYKGSLQIPSSEQVQFEQIYNNGQLYTILSEGTCYSANVPFSLIVYRKNLVQLKDSNTFTSLATTYFINSNTENFKTLNNLWKKKIGFTTNDYNFYALDYYYDYYVSSNSYALDCIRICAIKVFLWNLIFKLAKLYNINIDFAFYETFYTCIFENLDGTKPILAEQVNVYFNKYHENFRPIQPYNSIIEKWSTAINFQRDVVNILIFKQASYALNLEQLEALDYIALFKYFDYQTVKFRFLECLSVNKPVSTSSSKPANSLTKLSNTKKSGCSNCSSSKSSTSSKTFTPLVKTEQAKTLDLNDTSPTFVMYYAPWCGHCKTFKPEFEKLGSSFQDKIKILNVNPKEVSNQEYIKGQKINGFPTVRYYHSGLNGDYENYKGPRTEAGLKTYLETKLV
jgi:thiol-disulfide isomerase/thioredoxin